MLRAAVAVGSMVVVVVVAVVVVVVVDDVSGDLLLLERAPASGGRSIVRKKTGCATDSNPLGMSVPRLLP